MKEVYEELQTEKSISTAALVNDFQNCRIKVFEHAVENPLFLQDSFPVFTHLIGFDSVFAIDNLSHLTDFFSERLLVADSVLFEQRLDLADIQTRHVDLP